MSSYDYVPASDAEFNTWQANLMYKAKANASAYGILETDIDDLTGQQATWTTAYAKASNKNDRTSGDTKAKDEAREVYEKALRNFVAQWLANNSKVSNGDRERMGLTVKSETRTPSAIPTTSPVGSIDFSVRLQHTINYVDSSTPTKKAKPDGVHGCEVWIKMGDDTSFNYLATHTRTPYVASFNDTDAAKTAFYRLRWVNTRGEQGPWSSIVSAMIVG